MNIIKQKGASTVEFAMIVPILLVLIFMVSELGTMFYKLNTLTKSVQVAARYFSDLPTNSDTLKDENINTNAKNLICYGYLKNFQEEDKILADCDGTKLTVAVTKDTNHVTVTAQYSADWMLVGAVVNFLGLSGNSMTLTASSVMRFAQ